MKRKRYRYILCGVVNAMDPISDYRLIGANEINEHSSAIRVNIPYDVKLSKYRCDCYSTTSDTRTLETLGYDVLVNFNGIWKIRNDLKVYQPHEYHEILKKEDYYVSKNGFLTKDEYNAYLDEIDKKNQERTANAKKLQQQLNDYECEARDLEYLSKEELIAVLERYVIDERIRRIKQEALKDELQEVLENERS